MTIINPRDEKELALPIEGKKKNLKRTNFDLFATGLGLNQRQVSNIYRRFMKSRETAYDWIDRSFLSGEYADAYKTLLDDRCGLLE